MVYALLDSIAYQLPEPQHPQTGWRETFVLLETIAQEIHLMFWNAWVELTGRLFQHILIFTFSYLSYYVLRIDMSFLSFISVLVYSSRWTAQRADRIYLLSFISCTARLCSTELSPAFLCSFLFCYYLFCSVPFWPISFYSLTPCLHSPFIFILSYIINWLIIPIWRITPSIHFNSNVTGLSKCLTCPSRHFCRNGITPEDCPPGQYCPVGSGEADIQPCPPGTWDQSVWWLIILKLFLDRYFMNCNHKFVTSE